jgi:Na+/proline symporter
VEAKKNIFWFSISLFFVNIVFLFLGGLLYLYADQHGMDIPKGDQLFPLVAKDLGVVTAVIFTLGVIAAAYSSADSALTSLTTSFSLDILKMKEDQPKKRYIIHAGFSLILFIAVVIFEAINDDSVIVKLFTVAGYTYGPILGLFSFSLMSKRTVKDQWVPYIAIGSVIVTFLIAQIEPDSIGGFKMGFELLLINGICTWSGLFAISKK